MKRFARILLRASLLTLVVGIAGGGWAYREINRTPGELLRYAQKRLYGHTRLESVLLPPLLWARDQVERKIDGLPPALALRGSRSTGLPAQAYDNEGKPLAADEDGGVPQLATQYVHDSTELLAALNAARPGDVIELAPGRYELRKNLHLAKGGARGAPIQVRAARPDSVVVEIYSREGFVIASPYWLFENLHFVGACKNHNYCEHAFHIVGPATGVVIRNNVIREFNAAIKVNGLRDNYPDFGLVQRNHIFNTDVRRTYTPVVGIDIVAANGWQVVDNLIADIASSSERSPAYAAYMKGGGSDGRFERNVVICQLALQRRPGTRVGLSLGGGNTGPSYFRRGHEGAEHYNGIVANNFVAHCNDFGIDVNGSVNARVAFNTLINTYGIDVRNAPASAAVYGNLVEGAVRSIKGGQLVAQNNRTSFRATQLADADRLDFAWIDAPPVIPGIEAVPADFCGTSRGEATFPGAFSTASGCTVIVDVAARARSLQPANSR